MRKFSEAGTAVQGSEDLLGISPIVNLVAGGMSDTHLPEASATRFVCSK